MDNTSNNRTHVAVPGSAVAWGSGAAAFLALAVIIAITERRMPQTPKTCLTIQNPTKGELPC